MDNRQIYLSLSSTLSFVISSSSLLIPLAFYLNTECIRPFLAINQSQEISLYSESYHIYILQKRGNEE